MVDELTGLGEEDTDATVTETAEEMKARYESEIQELNGKLKESQDGNSALGRKFKSYQEDNEDKYGELLEKIESISTQRSAVDTETEDDEYDDADGSKRIARLAKKMAKEEVDVALRERELNRTKLEKKYVSDYDRTIQALGDSEDPQLYENVLEELQGMPGYTTNGGADAEKNYRMAMINVLKGNSSTSITRNAAFRQNNPKGTQVGGSTTVVNKDVSTANIEAAKKDPALNSLLAYRATRKGDNDKFLERTFGTTRL